MTETGRRRVVELSPELGRLLLVALVADGRPDLADSIEELEAREPCSCGDAFCTSFYTGPRPDGAWGPDHENLVYDFAGGMLVLDVVEGVIRYVEVLDRPDLGWVNSKANSQVAKRTYENTSENIDLVLTGHHRSQTDSPGRS